MIDAPRRILVHDYSGHPFQVQLSRSLAARGHVVLHLHSSKFQTPKGPLQRRVDDPASLLIEGVELAGTFVKTNFVRRRSQEIAYGKLVARRLRAFRPDIVLSANAPLDSQNIIQRASRKARASFVFWQQDIYSEAMARILPQRLPFFGSIIARHYRGLEHKLVRRSDHVVAIAEDFKAFLSRSCVSNDRVSIVENWASVEDIVPLERDNPWADAHMRQCLRAVYSGTLGLKHDPQVLIEIARHFPGHLHVFTEGSIADLLAQQARSSGVENLSVEPWVKFDELPAMLAGADILVAMIEADAGAYSVPSKLLTYLCAGRPIVASIPAENLAARTLLNAQAGLVSDPGDGKALIANMARLAGDASLRSTMSTKARLYAEGHFGIDPITDRFETIFALSLQTKQFGEFQHDQNGARLWRGRLYRLASGATAQAGRLLGPRRRPAPSRTLADRR